MSLVHGLAAILPADKWSRLISTGVPRVFSPGRTLMRQGEPADHVVVILDGRVKVTKVDTEGHTLVLAIRGAGELVGELGLLQPNQLRTATVTAVDSCSTRVVPLNEFAVAARDLGLDKWIMEHVAARLKEGEDVRADMAVLQAGQRVVRTLLRLAVPRRRSLVEGSGRDGGIDVGLSQSELALASGVHRSTAADELRKLRNDDVVRTSRGRIVIVDVAQLQRRADESRDDRKGNWSNG